MGLLSWRRSGRSADSSEVAPAAPPNPGESSDRYVFRAATAADIPDWAKLPPLKPTLGEMPKIVPDFEPSLVSWQPPKRFLENLGHSISASGPSGLVEGMTVLTPNLPAETVAQSGPEPPHEPLPLAAPPATPAPRAEKAPMRLWRLPWNRADPAPLPAVTPPDPLPLPVVTAPEENEPDVPPASQPTDEPLLPAVATIPPVPLPEAIPDPPPPSVTVDTPAEPTPPVAGLVGSVPVSAVAQRVVVSTEELPEHRLVRAAAPPDMPLPRLSSGPLPKDEATEEPSPPAGGSEPFADLVRKPASEAPASEAPAVAREPEPPVPSPLTSGLVGERPILTEPAQPAGSPSPGRLALEPVEPAPPGGDLPLASPRPSIPTDDATRYVLAAESESRPGTEPVAGLSGVSAAAGPPPVPAPVNEETGPTGQAPEPPPPAPGATAAEPAPESSASPLPVSTASGPSGPVAPDAEPEPVAPLLGEGSPPIISESPASVPSLGSTDRPARSEREARGESASLVLPPPRPVPRAGLGEPMTSLPPTATSWDITSWSPAQQLRASRALIRSGGPGSNPTGPPAEQVLARLGPPRGAAPESPRPFPPETTITRTSLPPAALERIASPSPGVAPPELPPASPEQAPLLSMDPLVGAVEPPVGPEAIEAGPFQTAQPPEGLRVRTAVGQRHGVDLMRVPVDRSSEGAAEARRGQARAFTSNRAVVIPTEVGSLETGPGAALFAHELTHVAQRARLGRDLPAESSPAGRLLESEALSAELALATGRSSPLEWPDAGGPPLGSRRAGAGPVLPGSHAAGALPLAGAAAGAPDIESLAASILDKMSVLSSPQSGAETTQVFTAPWSAGPAPAPAPAAPVQRAEQPAAAPASAPAGATAPDEQASPFGSRPSDQELNNLSRWLYPLIKYRLKGELREDRERAGLLTDHYRKW